MKHAIQFSAALALLLGIPATAQNLNPVVEVTNIYEQAATGIEKPVQQMAVPDSLLKFNLDMDYEVRTTPYRGAYEFNPYLVQLRTAPRSYEEQTLLIRLGAGYGFHPELDAVWSPVKKDNFRLNLYGRHQGYFGQYRNISLDTEHYFRGDGTFYSGADARTSVGVNGLYAWNEGMLTADVHYRNLFASDAFQEKAHHIAALQARVQSAPQTAFYYNVGLQARHLFREGFKETYLLSDGGVGANLRRSQIRLDYQVEGVFTGEGRVGALSLIPRYVFQTGGFRLNLGLKASFSFRSDDYFYPTRGNALFPDVYVDYQVVPESFVLQASVTGGNQLETYGSLLERNHFLPSFLRSALDFETESVHVSAGVRGNVSERVHYNVNAGYAFRANALEWGYAYDTSWSSSYPSAGRANYGLFYADAKAGWSSERLDADVHLRYQHSTLSSDYLFAPPALLAQFKFLYNWGGRIKAGFDLDAATERVLQLPEGQTAAVPLHVPGYADLGLYGEYGFPRRLAAWLRVGNLLNMEVQRTLFHAEKGIWFSVGAQYSF